jgi:putative ABC transport system permease protein
MSLPVPLRIAARELRGGLKGFRVFLACLALGVAAIAAVGSVRESISAGLEREGASILGGDASITLTYRFAEEAERAWLDANADAVSEIVDFRSMAVVPRGDEAERGLTQVKAVDSAYPIYGSLILDPPMTPAEAFAGQGGLPGAVMDPVLIARLGLEAGDTFRLGTQDFVLVAALVREPDAAEGGFGLGPRTMVLTADLASSGLLQPGTLFDSKYRMRLGPETDLDAFRAEAEDAFGPGIRWRDRRDGAPGVSEFVDRLGAFLVLVGLAGLAVGGVGVSAAVRSYLEEKTSVIATLKTLGAESRTIFLTYFTQIGVLTLLGIAIGLVLGALLPLALAPMIEARLPVPAAFGFHAAPLLEAAIYGLLAALLFTLWPLARTEEVRAAALFRDIAAPSRVMPRAVWLLAMAAIFAALVGLAVIFTDLARLTLWSAAGLVGAFGLLVLAARAVRWLAARAARSKALRGRTVPRLALGSVGGPGGEALSVVLSLGLGLTVLAAVGQIDWNLRAAIERDLPEVAPSFFVVDIQNTQIDDFRAGLEANPAVTKVESAPMLRGVITRINDRPADEVAGDHWVLEGDRGITYSPTPPEGTVITAGTWWQADHSGPAEISFAAEEAAEMGLSLGDRLTINVLGRDVEGEITSFREVDFSTAGIGFILSISPNALAGAPHTHIATIYADEGAEPALLRDLSNAYVNVTVIRVRDAIDRVAEVLAGIAAAVTYGALATLVTGGIVLVGAAAAGERARTYEAAVLKTIGATRPAILANFALRSAILGAAAGAVAILAGGLAGWAVTTFVMDTDFRFEPVSAVTIVVAGVLATMMAGLAFAWRPLSRRPAGVLRARE